MLYCLDFCRKNYIDTDGPYLFLPPLHVTQIIRTRAYMYITVCDVNFYFQVHESIPVYECIRDLNPPSNFFQQSTNLTVACVSSHKYNYYFDLFTEQEQKEILVCPLGIHLYYSRLLTPPLLQKKNNNQHSIQLPV